MASENLVYAVELDWIHGRFSVRCVDCGKRKIFSYIDGINHIIHWFDDKHRLCKGIERDDTN